MIDTSKGIDWLVEMLRRDQSPDGSWAYPFETGLSTDTYMIILLRTLEINDEELIKGLAERILSRQEKNGSWKLFYDEHSGNLTATVECYYALLYSGYYEKKDKRLQAAKKFILSKGGIEEVNMFTKVMLSLTGQLKWPRFSPLPIEIILLPLHFPINFYSFSVYGRANLTPMMILADKKFTLKTGRSPDLSDLIVSRNHPVTWIRSEKMRSLYSFIEEGKKDLMGLPQQLHRIAIQRAKKYMLDHIEKDGTFYSYYSSTFLMIFALLSLGYKKTDPVIIAAINGIKSMKTEINGLPHMQYTTANVWNTSLIGYALQEAGLSPEDKMVVEANQYLLDRQHDQYGDWVIHNPNSLPGGWGFSNINNINPDVDDTTASLRSISRMTSTNLDTWSRGINWLLSMQNDDGGWAAFEKNTDKKIFEFLPIEKGEFILTDPSCADITGRTLEFFGNYTNVPKDHRTIIKGVKWLVDHQEVDGSWYGRWGICYIYGTWSAVTGLAAVRVPFSDSSIQKAVIWLRGIQNSDGGWGESCYSDSNGKYTPLKESTLTHTAWALDALISVSDKPTPEIRKGISYLLRNLQKEDWTTDYPKGQGMAGAFYIHYHSYRYIFPLLSLAHYQRKFDS
ncbi:sporulenol synthase [Neobacillus niacini]|uniref:squalene--hopene cyclase n=1 Tax=Neobacillus niacini TaxID=86668 RepID=UPI00286186A8|nr:squalene--hopene cyclase [Neobacillus niacini]MDR7075572.1 sporulenol synthase [Neobacillus niacini]